MLGVTENELFQGGKEEYLLRSSFGPTAYKCITFCRPRMIDQKIEELKPDLILAFGKDATKMVENSLYAEDLPYMELPDVKSTAQAMSEAAVFVGEWTSENNFSYGY